MTALFPAASRAAFAGGRMFARRSVVGARAVAPVATLKGFHDVARARVHLEVRGTSRSHLYPNRIDLFLNPRTCALMAREPSRVPLVRCITPSQVVNTRHFTTLTSPPLTPASDARSSLRRTRGGFLPKTVSGHRRGTCPRSFRGGHARVVLARGG